MSEKLRFNGENEKLNADRELFYEIFPDKDLGWHGNEIVGVFAGVKPAALITDNYMDDFDIPEEDRQTSKRELDDAISASRKLGLACIKLSDGEYSVSKDEEAALALRDAIRQRENLGAKDREQYEELTYVISEMLGYPRTSTDAYLGKIDRLSIDEAVELERERPSLPWKFQGFVLSKDHYLDELEAYSGPLRDAYIELGLE